MKFCILLGYKFLVKNKKFRGQSVHFSSCDITKHGIYKFGHIFAIFKDRDFWFGPKNSLNLYPEHFIMFGVIRCISGRMTGHQLFVLKKSANIFEMVSVRHN